MVFGKWFGKGRPSDRERLQAMFASLDRTWRDAIRIVEGSQHIGSVDKTTFRLAVFSGDLNEARKFLRGSILSQLSADEQKRIRHAGRGEAWATLDDLADAGLAMPRDQIPVDALEIAWFPTSADRGSAIFFQGDGHLLTVAPTGAGKGQHFIIRSLLDYEGPAVVLDPKGENYRETAWRRNLFGQVYKWAPFEADSDCYNPLDFVSDWDDARVLADLMIVSSGRDQFWDMAARNLLTGLIIFVISNRPPEKRNMREVCRLLAAGPDDRDEMVRTLQQSDDDNLVDLGNRIAAQEDRLKESIYESLNTQLEVWRSKAIVATTSTTTARFSMKDIPAIDHMTARMSAVDGNPPGWKEPAEGMVTRGAAATVYIVIPPDKIGSYRSVLRVLLGQMLKVAMRTYDEIARDAEEDPSDHLPAKFPWWPMLFLIDEFPQLGYMAPIEEAISTVRSYNIRLWLFAQNLSQLSRVYDNWQTIMSGCRMQIFFRPNDMETAQRVSERIGRRRDIWGDEDWVASPQELLGAGFKDDCVIFVPNVNPIRGQLYPAVFENDGLQTLITDWKQRFGSTVARAPRPEQQLSEPDAADVLPDSAIKLPSDGDGSAAGQEGFEGDEEYEREVAEAKRRAEERRRAKNDGAPKPPTFD